METPNTLSPQKQRLHPLMATAAISVIVLAAVGVTALVMNHSEAQPSPYGAPTAAATAAQQQQLAARPAAEPAPVAVAPKVASSASRPATPNYGASNSGPSQPNYEAPVQVAQAAPVCRDCGTVDTIREIKVKGQGTGVGAVGGAVVGGLLGNMVGAGRGKALATVGGAVAGGFGGNAIEKNVRADVEHQMVVRLDNGGTRTFTQASPFQYREGERVRIVNGHVERG